MDTTKVILAKKEATYGTDPTPTGAANAVLTSNFTAKPLTGDKLDRNLDLPSRGAPKTAVTNRRSTFSYEVELAGSGAAGTAPGWMELIEGCGMAPAMLTANTSAVQKFLGAGVPFSSLTHWHWVSNQKRVANGARGTFGLNFAAGKYPKLRTNWLGLVPPTPVTASAAPVPSLARWIDPLEVNNDNTDFLLGGYAAVLKELDISADASLALRSLVGNRYANKGNHTLTVKITCEAVDVATKNYFATLGGLQSMQLVHGTAAGNIVQLDSNNLQILDIDESEEDDVLMHTITAQLSVVAGQDDLIITAK